MRTPIEITIAGKSVDIRDMNATMINLLVCLSDGSKMSLKELIKRTGRTKTLLWEAIHYLMDRNLLERVNILRNQPGRMPLIVRLPWCESRV